MYKRFFLFGFIAVLSFSSMAQDIITLKNGDDIEVLVETVGEAEIEYKKWDNQTGPVYVIKKTDVFMIKYRNGSKDVFNTPAKPAQAQVEQVRPVSTSSGNLQNEFYRIGEDDKAMLEFFRRNNFTDYYSRFNKECKSKKSANALLGVGLGLTGVGGILMVCGANQTVRAEDVDKAMNYGFLTYAGISLMGTGHLLIIVSIPTYAVAASRKKAIKNDFAKEQFGVTSYTYQPKLNFDTTAYGIGLTLNF